MKLARLLVVAFALALVAAACSTGYDRDSAYDDLTSDEFGFTDEQANCILDEVEAQGLEDVVIEDDIDDVDPADVDAVTNIFGECVLGEGLTGGGSEEELNSEDG